MRPIILLALAALLAACSWPEAASPTPTAPPPTLTVSPAAPAAPSVTPTAPGQAPPTVTPGGPSPTPFTPDAPTAQESSPTTVTSSAPVATLGYGHASAAAVISGADAIAVATSAGVLYLRLPDLAPLRFVALGAPVGAVAVSPGGRYTAASLGAAVRLLDERGDTLLALPGDGPVFSPDAALLAVSEYDSQGPATTQLVRVPGGAPVAALEGAAIAFSPDGRLLATLADDTVRLWDLASGQLTGERAGQGAAFAPDGSALAVFGPGGLEVLSLREGRLGAPRFARQEPARAAVFGERADELHVWRGAEVVHLRLPSGEALGALTGFYEGQGGIGPAGRLAWYVEAGGESPPRLTVLRRDGAIVHADAAASGGRPFFSADGRTLVVVDDLGTVAVYDADAGPLGSRQVAGYGALAFASDGLLAAARRGGAGLDLWRPGAATPERGLELRAGGLDRVRELTAEGGRLVVEREAGSYLGGLLLMQADAWAPEGVELVSLRREELPFDQLGFEDRVPWDYSAAAGLLARGVAPSAGGGVLVDDPAGGAPRLLPAIRGVAAGARPLALAFSPDGGRLALGYDDGTLLVVAAGDLAPLASGPLGAGGAIEALAWSGDGRVLALATADGGVAVWEVGEDAEPLRFAAPQGEGWPPSLALSADGSVLAVGSAGGLAAYNLARGAETLRLGEPVEGVALLPDGGLLAASVRGQVVAWPVP